ncbi:FecR family protein [Lacinutrix chionoecetis]
MKKEELIKKWLDNSLNSQELEAFKQLDDYNELMRLNTALQQFKPSSYPADAELEKLQFALKSKTKTQKSWLKPFVRIAAVLAICFATYYYTTTLNTTINTQIAEKETIALPDNSQVILNAETTLAFNKKNWSTARDIDLNGEAYFKVAKGSKFSVHTSAGDVSVLGTEFNVKNRADLFEVVCYEGSVKVTHDNSNIILKPGNSFLIINGKHVKTPLIKATNPFWINNESAFKSMPYAQVIAEFERQYNVTFSVNTIDTNQLFTGSFAHNNLDVALQAITIPLNLTYSKSNTKILLKRE